MAKRPDSIEDFQRKRREKGPQRGEEPEYTRGQQDDRNIHIKRGQEAWLRHKEDATWNDWMAIGQALSIGREDAMAAAGTNAPVGSRYNVEFGNWLVRHKFDDIDKGDRSRLFDVMANLPAIEEWRHALPQNQRLKFNHPNTVLRRWKADTVVKQPKDPKPTLRDSVVNLSEDNAAKDLEIAGLKAHVAELESSPETTADVTADKLLGEALQALTKCFTSMRSSEADMKELLSPELYAKWHAQQKAATRRDKLR
jgi:hypothetical protein